MCVKFSGSCCYYEQHVYISSKRHGRLFMLLHTLQMSHGISFPLDSRRLLPFLCDTFTDPTACTQHVKQCLILQTLLGGFIPGTFCRTTLVPSCIDEAQWEAHGMARHHTICEMKRDGVTGDFDAFGLQEPALCRRVVIVIWSLHHFLFISFNCNFVSKRE